ncbi:penicillin-binding protein 1A [Oceanospirillum sediminis]|uniref:Penicillin-binding protein 1A n=1 Tax=Oceanospirillum sediminis TaxID=2760088 RepID=A0A839ITY0_9GAMM|nr:penicillin-binding protein 1A [Oceanospirillum sediminis]MBB1487939.1 penicillin-binding protein 1A [Oceanospirillum sediminis]
MNVLRKMIKWLTYFLLAGVGGAGVVGLSIVLYLGPQLPDIEQLRNFQLQTPLRIFTRDEKLIGEFGEKRRNPVTYDEIPQAYIQAILAAEDTRFFSHSGIDIKGLARAFVQLAQSGRIQSGGSTITMQVARNYLLTLDQTFTRKFKEILIALQMEKILSKEDIMALYVNKIYLGNRAYGIDAAAEVYYGKELHELSLAQLAMIAGLPKAPSRYNPIVNPRRALLRRNWIIQRMFDLNMIDKDSYDQAVREPITARYHGLQREVEAPYVAEMVRKEVAERMGRDDLYTAGYRVYTTVDSKAQTVANAALIDGLLAYDKRHGWRGGQQRDIPPFVEETEEKNSIYADGELDLGISPETGAEEAVGENISNWLKVLRRAPSFSKVQPAIVSLAEGKKLQVVNEEGEYIDIPWQAVTWASRYRTPVWKGPKLKAVTDIVRRGDLVYIEPLEEGWGLSQIPEIQGAFVSLSPDDGGVMALLGGFNFYQNKFNRAYQGGRQAGSVFKPFVYMTALMNGYTAASLVNDAPVVFEDVSLESAWRPSNSSGKFYGPTRLRHALYQSRNLVSIRLMQSVGVEQVIELAQSVGFNPEELPANLSLSLGSAELSPLNIAAGYSVIANGGYKVTPHLIERIESSTGEVLFQASTPVVCKQCEASTLRVVRDGIERPVAPKVLDERVVYIMHSMLKDVIKKGTGRRALVLKRNDIAGKTGTTNDRHDAWFSGFNQDLVATVWVGFDKPQATGEYGGKAALPVWIDYMGAMLEGKPESNMLQPPGIVTVKIDPATGRIARPGQTGAIFEVFRKELAPRATSVQSPASTSGTMPGMPAEAVVEEGPAAEALF